MKLFLHEPERSNELSGHYERAFKNSIELLIVSAYLTEWDPPLKLGRGCQFVRIVVGKDFGITRKKACQGVLNWLPRGKKSSFLVADSIQGFHPKAVFWKEEDRSCHAIVGSSNLTRAAFKSNYEVNAYSVLSLSEYEAAKSWLAGIELQSLPVSEDWLNEYVEAAQAGKKIKSGRVKDFEGVLFAFELPKPRGMLPQIRRRREQMLAHKKVRSGLVGLFRRCANGEISSSGFYAELPEVWGFDVGNRFQYLGWERQGKKDDFQELAKSFLRVLDTPRRERDDIVASEVDRLAGKKISSRGSFFSEMLCLQFPEDYPVLNKPVWEYLRVMGFGWPRGSSEGSKYIDLARKLRMALRVNPGHPAKNLAELDTVIWKKYGGN